MALWRLLMSCVYVATNVPALGDTAGRDDGGEFVRLLHERFDKVCFHEFACNKEIHPEPCFIALFLAHLELVEVIAVRFCSVSRAIISGNRCSATKKLVANVPSFLRVRQVAAKLKHPQCKCFCA